MLYVNYGDNGKEMAKAVLSAMDVSKELDPKLHYGIKPNLVLAKPSDSGATTDPQIVAGIIEYLKDHNCRHITIMESSWLGDSTLRAFKLCGYRELADKYGVELRDLKQDNSTLREVDDLELAVCTSPLQVDYLINVPVLKAHCQTKLTCALKNLKGCIPDQEKRRYNTLGLHKPIAALNQVLKQHLIIVDGIIGDLTFEEGGTPVNMHRLIAGKDPVEVDSYCAELLGYEPDEIPYLALAQQKGVGSYYERVRFLNSQQDVRIPDQGGIEHLKANLMEDQACSACVGSAIHALKRLADMGHQLPAVQLKIGQGFKEKTNLAGVGIGNCTKGCQTHVPGCPPTARQILKILGDA